MKAGSLVLEGRKLASLAIIPVALILIILFTVLDIRTATEPPFLLTILNTVFIGIIPLVIATIAFRSYRSRGSASLFMMGSGMMIFGLGSIAAGWLIGLPQGTNISVAIYNVCIFISAVFYLSGALLTFTRSKTPGKTGSSWKIAAMAAGIIIFAGGFIALALAGSIPPFFVAGSGPTVLRQVILSNAIALFSIASILLFHVYRQKREDFFFWYSVALAVIAIGLVAALFIPAIGSPVNWISRALQYIGAGFALLAIVVAGRLARDQGNSLEETLSRFFSESETNYRSLVETATDAIVVFDSDDRVLVWNRAAENMFGYSASEAVGSSFIHRIIPDEFADKVSCFREPVTTPETEPRMHSPFETEVMRKDGNTFPAELALSRHMVAGTRVCTVIIRDLTERKKADETLKEAHERTSKILEGIADTFFSLDSGWRFTVINPAAEKAPFGRPASELLGRGIWELYPSLVGTRIHQHYLDAAMNHSHEHYEALSPLNRRWYEIFMQGQKGGVDVYMRDITDRKNAEDALRESEAQLRTVLENTTEGVIVAKIDGELIHWNRTALQMHGYSDIEEARKFLHQFAGTFEAHNLDGMPVPLENWPMARVFRGEKLLNLELRIGRLDQGWERIWSYGGNIVRDVDGAPLLAIITMLDITDRKMAEEARLGSQARLETVFAAIPDMIVEYDANGTMVRANEALLKATGFTGFTREIVLGKLDARWADGRPLAPGVSPTARALKGNIVKDEIMMITTADGRRLTVSAYAAPLVRDGIISGAIGIWHDITELKQAEEALRESEEKFRVLTQNLQSAVALIDEHGAFSVVNASFLCMFDIPADADILNVNNQDWARWQVFNEDCTHLEVDQHPVRKAALTGMAVKNQLVAMKSPCGPDLKWLLISAEPILDVDGGIHRIICTYYDITDRRNAEEELRQSEERFRLALRNAPVSVALQDTDLIYKWAYNQTTRKTDEIVGKTDADLFAAEDVAWLTPLKHRMLVTGDDVHAENWLTSNGRRVYLDLYFEPLRNKGGEITGIGIAAVDLTDLKLAKEELQNKNDNLNALNEELTATEEELNQNIEELSLREEDLSKALAEKEVLLSEIHHRVKNNLTAFISLLSLEGSTEETPAGRSLKQDLQNRARSMALIHETLYRTHMYNNVDMGMYLTTLLDQVTNSLQTIKLVKTIVDAHGVMLDIPRATPSGLIVNELITNSFKYAFPESFDTQKVRNAPPTITVTFAENGGEYVMTVRDNGIGLPPGLDISTTKTLGLKLVNFLARHQLNAMIEVNTGKGTEFIFRFKV